MQYRQFLTKQTLNKTKMKNSQSATQVINKLKEIATEQESEINSEYTKNTLATIERLQAGTFTKNDILLIKWIYDDWHTDYSKLFSKN